MQPCGKLWGLCSLHTPSAPRGGAAKWNVFQLISNFYLKSEHKSCILLKFASFFFISGCQEKEKELFITENTVRTVEVIIIKIFLVYNRINVWLKLYKFICKTTVQPNDDKGNKLNKHSPTHLDEEKI